MTEQQFYDIVLSVFNVRREPNDGTQEDVLIQTYRPLANIQCARIYDWSFQTRTYEYCHDDVMSCHDIPFRSFRFAYRLPSDFVKVLYINGEYEKEFQVSGNEIWVNEPIRRLDYISSNDRYAPEDYKYLEAYYTAISISQMLDSAGTAMQRAQNLAAMCIANLKETEAANKREKPIDLDAFIFDSPAFSNDFNEIRRRERCR